MNDIVDLLGKGAGIRKDALNLFPGTFVQGIVTEGQNAENKGRVKVEFTAWTSGKNTTAWMPVVTPFAGGPYGLFRLPKVGDIVLVGFIGEGLKRPFVIGSLFPNDSAFAGENYAADTDIYRLKTNGGIDLKITDKSGEEKVELILPSGANVTIDESAKTMVCTDGGGKNKISIDSQNGKVDILADSSITLTAGQASVSLFDGNISISGGEITAKANQTITLKGGTDATVEGGTGATLKGGSQVSVQGPQAELKGDGMTTISGGMVKIN